MRKKTRMTLCMATCMAVGLAGLPAFGEIEAARDLMEEGRFKEARAALWPAARSGNADAEELIGVMYAMGGLPAIDLVRAYMWYTLSAIGGDPDAAISLEEVVKKMTPEQIEEALILVDDYKVWMYPFR